MPRKLRLSMKKGRNANGRRNSARSTQRNGDTNITIRSEQASKVSTVAESTQDSVVVFVEPPNKKPKIDKDMATPAEAEVGPSCGPPIIPPQATRTWQPAAGPSHVPSQNAYVFETREGTPPNTTPIPDIRPGNEPAIAEPAEAAVIEQI